MFTNIAPGSADVVRPWVEALRNVGFAVFAKPKIDDDTDVDADMLNHIALRHSFWMWYMLWEQSSSVPPSARYPSIHAMHFF